ncbi:MAG: LacI family DNA-binding transcriptional regulator [candidate division KSB1 bacterium]|nr:LacI family DNA-binding transcriptional regulator [candidate division KSB1 bacterium]
MQSVIRENQFIPNRLARGFRLQQTHTIGMVVGDVDNRFLALLEKSIESSARQQGYHLIVVSSDDDPDLEQQAVQNLISKSVDALIIITVLQDTSLHQQLNKNNIPIVYVDRYIKKSDPFVATDNVYGGYELTRRFLSQGYKRIAFIGGEESTSTNRDRFRGYCKALQNHQIEPDPDLIIHGDFTSEGGYQSTRTLFSRLQQKPDAVFTSSFTLFEGMLSYFKETDPSFLRRIRMATFDDHPLLDFLPFPVNSALQEYTAVGKNTVQMLLNALNGVSDIKSAIIKPRLIYRDHLKEASSWLNPT